MKYPGSNDETTMEGNTKQTYAKKTAKQGCSCNLKKLLKKVRSK